MMRSSARHVAARTLPALLVLTIGTAALAMTAGGQQGTPAGRGNLRPAAKAAGPVTVTQRYPVSMMPFSLQELTALSPVVVVGRPTANRSRLARGGRSVEAIFTVAVEDVLRQKVGVNREVSVVVPGGRYGFEDGTWAEVKVIDFARPVNGQRYLWFLEPSQPGEGRSEEMVPVFGPLGIYELPDDSARFVFPSGLVRSRFAQSVIRLALGSPAFLQKVKGYCNE